MTRDSSPLDPEHAAFIQGGVSIIAASRNQNNQPNLSRAIGCRISADFRRVTLYLYAAQSGALLADVRANGAIAVVFSQPSTHRTLQLKGVDAEAAVLTKDDVPILAAYRHGLAAELESICFPEPFTRALFSCPTGDAVAVSFTIAEAFVQTPGPKAGTPLHTNQ